MTGLLALNGGREHTSGCESIDRHLLAESGVARPQVTVMLAATAPHRRAFKIAEAWRYWGDMGADVRIGFTGRPDDLDHAMELLEDPDLVVLTGGYPWLLHQRLRNTEVLDRLFEVWQSGVPLSGSSAGAMALCEWWYLTRGPHPLRLINAFGLVPGTAAAPHFENFDIDRITRWVVRRNPHLTGIGLPNRTALVGRGAEFTVRGQGNVALIRHDREERFGPGAALLL